MTVSIGHLQPIIALLAGILILVMPRLLNYIVAIYRCSARCEQDLQRIFLKIVPDSRLP